MSRSRAFFVFLLILLLLICILVRVLIAYWDLIHSYFQTAHNNKDAFDNSNKNNTPINTNNLLRYEKSHYNLPQHSSSLESWLPFKVNESCPIFAVESNRKQFLLATRSL